MLRARSALARVCLCLVCLLGLPVAEPRSRDLLNQVRKLIQIAPQLKDSGCRLYTPTAEYYEQRCPRSSLRCFSEEIQVLVDEWRIADDAKIPPFGFKRGLGQLATEFNGTESGCLRCELLPEEEAKTFLHELEGILQKRNSRSLSP